MIKTIKIMISVLIGIFFSIASLEIDVFDYDNSFFDSYDSYVKVESKAVQRALQVDLRRLATPEIILPTFHRPDVDLSSALNNERPFPSPRPCNRKLFIVKSCLLI